MFLAGDIGGTKTLLGLFEPDTRRPRPVVVREFHTLDYSSLPDIIAAFTRDAAFNGVRLRSACFGVAGPVIADAAELTNVPWRVEARAVAAALEIDRVALLNDLQAMAYGVPVLTRDEVFVLQDGEPIRGGNMALLAAGTGLGEALLHNVGGRFIPSPSEGGHADFPARNDREIALLRDLTEWFGRASVERVVSGNGLLNLHRHTHKETTCLALASRESGDAAAVVSAAALERRCPSCVDALELFVDAYGAEAGNLALRAVSTGGLFVGGGIAPKIMPAMTDGRFMRAFHAKAPFEELLRAMPVHIILNPRVALLGAAVYAAGDDDLQS